ncbi:MAG: hypothetical protein OQK73_07955 [Gammaproteobacteria bacterium]|nr:hypothetical protein [Gammaproteobacteria bacterium]
MSKDNNLIVYGAIISGDTLGETFLLQADFDRNYQFYTIAYARKVEQYKDRIQLEYELQYSRHTGEQYYNEYNILIILRKTFGQRNNPQFSLAVGEGLSYIDELSEIEALHHTKTNRLLNYLLFEFTARVSETPNLHSILRLHHRSGIYGLFKGVHGASNAIGLGLKYQF